MIQNRCFARSRFLLFADAGRGNRRYFEVPKTLSFADAEQLLTAKNETLAQPSGIFGPYFTLSGTSCCCEMIPLSVLRSH
jgi:hypothetical protein